MAILQEANAVFYHPLDDVTESLQAQAWSGPSSFGPGTVSDALGPGPGDSVSFGADVEFNSTGVTSGISTAVLSATTIVVAYMDEADSNHGTAKVGTISGTDITFGAEAEFQGALGGTAFISVVALSPTTFVVAYRDGADSLHGTAKVGTVSGTNITFGAESEFNGVGQTDYISATKLDATKFVVAYQDVVDNLHGTAKVGTVAGTDITFGTEAEFRNTGSVGPSISVAALSTTTFVVAYRDASDVNHGTAKVGTVTGTAIVFGTESEFLAANGAAFISTAALSATAFVVAYMDTADSGHGTAKVGTVSGTDITFGAEAEFAPTAPNEVLSISALSSTAFVVAYRDEADSNHGKTKVGAVSGTDITFGPSQAFLSEISAAWISVSALSETEFVVAYQDRADGDRGTSKVGSTLGAASLVDTSSFGPETEFSLTVGSMSVVPLSATAFVVAYQNSTRGSAKVGTISGTDITFGPRVDFRSTVGVQDVSAAALSPTAFVVAYTDNADSDHGTAKVGTVSGTDITFGAETEFQGGFGTISNSAAALSATAFVVAYRDEADSGHGTAKVGTVSGTDITFGAESEFLSTGVANGISAAALSPTIAIVAYLDVVDANHGTAKVGSVSGTAITFGAEVEFLSTSAAGSLSAAALDATKFIIAYRNTGDLDHGTARIGTVSGTDITFGGPAEFNFTGATDEISVAAISATKFVVAYRDGADSDHGTAKVGTVSGTNITFGAESEFLSAGAANEISVAAIDAGQFVVAYQDGSDSFHGTAKVGTASDYPTVVGGEHLTFATWTRSPNIVPSPTTTPPPTTTAP